MKKVFKFYFISWIVLFAIFNLLAFTITANLGNFDTNFWIGYAFISIVFVGQLICGHFAFKADSLQKTFYNISLLRISYISLIVSIVVGTGIITISVIPNWVGIIICALILAFSVVSILKASLAIETVSSIDEKIKQKTAFIKDLTVEAEILIPKVRSNDIRKECQIVYEAIRFSDPMSDVALNDVEEKISKCFKEFKVNVEKDDIEKSQALSKELQNLIIERNAKCKRLK